jgi:ATP-dependent 26S proteasome regulatory subunit
VPGPGKTLLAFLRIVGSELIQKYLGDGPKLVRELFRVAEEMAPSIVFIDEIDAVGTKRYDSNSGGEREIQRTMLELLNQLDGFDSRGDVKVIMATNKIESLDPALIRPGRIDRKIEFPYAPRSLLVVRLRPRTDPGRFFVAAYPTSRRSGSSSRSTRRACRFRMTLTWRSLCLPRMS